MLLLTTEPLWGTFKAAVLATAGGGMYCGVELLFRGRTHWTMVLVGGICFLLIGLLNERYPWEMALTSQMLLAAAIVTAAEFLVGMVLNVWMRLDIWNYSDMPYNLLGQISLLFSCGWFLLSLPAIVLDDWLRHWWFGERKPAYKLL